MNLKKIDNPFGGRTFYKESTTSTMAEAEAEVSAVLDDENIHGLLFIADHQTDGVGRVPGRKWLSSPDKNLTFTLVISKDFIGHGYGTTPLKAGLALSNVIKDLTGMDAKVKWPNDVFVQDKKISGILCRSNKKYVMVGVGINVNQLEFDDSINNITTSLSKLTNNGYNLEMVLSKFLNNFYNIFKSNSWLNELNESLYRQGTLVTFCIGNPANNNIVKGELVGLDEQGKVVIKDENGKNNSYLSGEFI